MLLLDLLLLLTQQPLYRGGSILAIRRLPQSENNIVKYYVLQIRCKMLNL
jgi:hypothetical protein